MLSSKSWFHVNSSAIKIPVLLSLLASLTACNPVPSPEFSETSTVTVEEAATATLPPTTATPSSTAQPMLTPTPTLAPIGQVQPIPSGFVYLGDKNTLALGFNMDAGGSIGSLLYKGRELVDRTDLGRYIQLSFYDGNDTYGDWNDPSDIYGWNPEQAGDKAWFGATVLEYRTADEGIYIKAIGKEWGHIDEDSDMLFETWAWERAGYFEVHLRGTHTGTDTHVVTGQEFPATYFATSLTHEFGYFGDAPFTGAPIEELNLVGGPVLCPPTVPTENWAAFGTADGLGLILAVPPQRYLTSNWFLCLLAHATPAVGYIAPSAYFDIPPGAIREETIYLIPGPIDEGRAIVYNLIPHTNWTFDLNSAEGWSSNSAAFNIKDGINAVYLSADDWLSSPGDLLIAGRISPSISIRARTQKGEGRICLQFITTMDRTWNNDKSECLTLPAGDFQTYEFPMKRNPDWNENLITQLRLTALTPTRLEIDSLIVDRNGYTWEFEVPENHEGWTLWNHLETLEVRDGNLLMNSTGDDPYLGSPAISIDASTLPAIEIRMNISAGNSAQIFFTTDLDSEFDEPKSLIFTPVADGSFHTYTLDMSSVDQWQGKITQIRLDPTDQPASIEIDYIRIVGAP